MELPGFCWEAFFFAITARAEMFLCVFVCAPLISADKDRAAVIKGSDSQRWNAAAPIVRVIH
jgi:hypothetical protein